MQRAAVGAGRTELLRAIFGLASVRSGTIRVGQRFAEIDSVDDDRTELRARFELEPDVEGVVIVDVTEGGPASEESLRPGDVLEVR